MCNHTRTTNLIRQYCHTAVFFGHGAARSHIFTGLPVQ
jgi:hypothetical protein